MKKLVLESKQLCKDKTAGGLKNEEFIIGDYVYSVLLVYLNGAHP